MNSLESVNEKLTKASQLLNTAAQEIRDFGFNKGVHIKRIGTTLTYIFEVQHEIYEQRPDLKPDFLND
jgi:hypothetical protein